MSATKYTEAKLDPIIQSSRSYAEVLRKLELKPSGGNQSHIRKTVAKLNLDTSHFLGQAWSAGSKSLNKKSWRERLVMGSLGDSRINSHQIRSSLIESGRPYICEGCDNPGIWQGLGLTLHVHHKDGQFHNNLPDNLAFVCPNCHSQTPNFGCRSKTHNSVRRNIATVKNCRVCLHDGCSRKLQHRNVSGYCTRHRTMHVSIPHPSKIEWPTPDCMRKLVTVIPTSVIAGNLGVSGVAVAKFCKKHNIARKTRGEWMKKLGTTFQQLGESLTAIRSKADATDGFS